MPPTYLPHIANADQQAVTDLSAMLAQRFAQPKKGFIRFREPFEAIGEISAKHIDVSDSVVTIGSRQELSDEQFQQVNDSMRSFMPWRKGPFEVFGIEIDAEWRSEQKWQHLQPHLPDLSGKVIADIGCNNGYYMFRMADSNPAMVLGFEPYVQHYFAFKTLNSLAGLSNLHIEPFGVENIDIFPNSFDVIFLMGIIYHRISPVEMLRDLKKAMRPGGVLVLESQAIPGDEPYALFPEKTYAKVPGTFFVPTVSCLKNWLTRAGFSQVDFLLAHPMSSENQRRTEWMTFESYSDFIDPNNPQLTIEGYPAPLRAYFIARCN